MIFQETGLPGAYLIHLEKKGDERGFFARAWCRREFEEHGLVTDLAQANVSVSSRRGTLRGLHFQVPPAAEAKIVRCTRGAIQDVILDLRPTSPTKGRWLRVQLTAANRTTLYVPEGFAHGFQTLTDDAEVFYLVSHPYSPEHERGVRYDDPAFGIPWPRPVTEISPKDRAWPDYVEEPALRTIAVPETPPAEGVPAGSGVPSDMERPVAGERSEPPESPTPSGASR